MAKRYPSSYAVVALAVIAIGSYSPGALAAEGIVKAMQECLDYRRPASERIDACTCVIELHPDGLLAYHVRAQLSYEQGDLEQAKEDYDLILLEHPDDHRALSMRGV